MRVLRTKLMSPVVVLYMFFFFLFFLNPYSLIDINCVSEEECVRIACNGVNLWTSNLFLCTYSDLISWLLF